MVSSRAGKFFYVCVVRGEAFIIYFCIAFQNFYHEYILLW